jgi:hypothetical protein
VRLGRKATDPPGTAGLPKARSRRRRGRRTPVLLRSRRETRRVLPPGGSSGPRAAIPTLSSRRPGPHPPHPAVYQDHHRPLLAGQCASAVLVSARRSQVPGEAMRSGGVRHNAGTRTAGRDRQRHAEEKFARRPLRALSDRVDWGIHRHYGGGEARCVRWGPGVAATEGEEGLRPIVGGQSRTTPEPVVTESQGGMPRLC